MIKKTALLILDGWGIGNKPSSDAIYQANTPFFDMLWNNYPHSTLTTFGEDVGLPEGQMGNSEVGHMNIGAGRVVYQELVRINLAMKNGILLHNDVLKNAVNSALETNKAFHLIGLVSDGGVHSHLDHLISLVDIISALGVKKIYIHAFTDGRDTDPKSGTNFIRIVETAVQNKAQIVTVIGRYYAMDRDKRWERIKLAYDSLVNNDGKKTQDILEEIENMYKNGVTDEFLTPIILNTNSLPSDNTRIKSGDVVLNFNFRTDRPREITQVLTQEDMHEFNMHKLDLHYITMTEYDATFKNIDVLFHNDKLENTLGDVIANSGYSQLRIAETEKYPHVTFFFNGGRENPFKNENRIMIPSPKVATYDLQPEMSAEGIKYAVSEEIRNNQPDFICLNFANTDMVGHTGVFEAAVKAAETVDKCLSEIVPIALQKSYDIFIIADHGNADYMINEDGTPNTQHSMNPVPVIFISNEKAYQTVKSGKLADIAPTILKNMGINVPVEMTGNNLLE
jgi:2,3-bisphosphoglycerate-independent phosphoglycerate mutase